MAVAIFITVPPSDMLQARELETLDGGAGQRGRGPAVPAPLPLPSQANRAGRLTLRGQVRESNTQKAENSRKQQR